MSDILAALQIKANLNDEAVREMRLCEVHSGKIYKELRDDFNVASINEYSTLYAERIPSEELNMELSERVINAFNFDKEPNRTHGVPFKFVVKPVRCLCWIYSCIDFADLVQGEIFKVTKERLSKRTGIKGKQFEKIKFAVVPRATFPNPRYLEDGEISSPCSPRFNLSFHMLTLLRSQTIFCRISWAIQTTPLVLTMRTRTATSGVKVKDSSFGR